jgi:hypothetical protein
MFCVAQSGMLPDFVNNSELSICFGRHFSDMRCIEKFTCAINQLPASSEFLHINVSVLYENQIVLMLPP